MAADLLNFLKKKCLKDLDAAKKNVPYSELLEKISSELTEKSFPHEKTHEAINLLYDLNFLLDDCVTDHHKKLSSACSMRDIQRKIDATKIRLCQAQNIRGKLEKTLEDLKSLAESRSPPSDGIHKSSISVIQREGFPYFVKSEICGFAAPFHADFNNKFVVPLNYFKEFIVRKKQRNVAMAFVGIGGSGKSTLARMIFLDEEVQKEFNNVVLWVDCSDVSRPEDELPCITVEKFRHTASPCKYTLEKALRSLHDIIRDRRCLVVLDGAWIWNAGIKSFVDVVTGQLRGTVIITTRSIRVAENLVGKGKNIFYADKFCILPAKDGKNEEVKKKEGIVSTEDKEEKNKEENKEEINGGAKKEDVGKDEKMQKQAYCWSIFKETLERKKFEKFKGVELDSHLDALKDVIKRSSLGNPLAAKTLAEVISQRLYTTGYWAKEKERDEENNDIVENWEFLLKVDVYDHLSLSKVWYRVLSTTGVLKESSYYHKNELLVTSTCHPREVLRALRDVCHVEFILMSQIKTKTT